MTNGQQRAWRSHDLVAQAWRRRVALVLVAGFVVATAFGLCVAYLF